MKKLLVGLLALGSFSVFSMPQDFTILNKTSEGAEKLSISCLDDNCEIFAVEHIVNDRIVNENTIHYADVLKARSLKVDGGLEYGKSEFWFGNNEDNEGFVAPFSRGLIDGTSRRWKEGHELEVVGRYALTPISFILDTAALVVSSPYLIIAGASKSNTSASIIRRDRRDAKKVFKILNKDKDLELKQRRFKKVANLLLNFQSAE